MNDTETLKGYLRSLKVGRPITYENLSLYPMHDGHSQALAYLLLEEALASGKLRVSESGGGTVPELLLVNDTDQMVFLMDGEALVGAKQNRVLNTSLMVAAHSSNTIPVSCVEQHRWAFTSPEMKSGSISYPELRNLKSRSVHDSLRHGRSYRSDQGRVWDSVHAKLEAMKVGSATASMEEVYRAHRSSIQDFTGNLPYPPGACGVIAAIGDRIVCADLFNSAPTLEKLWSRLVSSYAVDAMEARNLRKVGRAASAAVAPEGAAPAATAPAAAAPSQQAASEFLVLPGEAQLEAFPSPGLGSNLRFAHPRCSGHALVCQGTVVHTALFAGEERAAGSDSSIRQPSRRRPL